METVIDRQADGQAGISTVRKTERDKKKKVNVRKVKKKQKVKG